jgi:hypothetical protein
MSRFQMGFADFASIPLRFVDNFVHFAKIFNNLEQSIAIPTILRCIEKDESFEFFSNQKIYAIAFRVDNFDFIYLLSLNRIKNIMGK